MLKSFGTDIWIASGPDVIAFAGFHFPTQMAVIRLANGDLFVWSPIELTDALRTEVDQLGPVAYIIAPNNLHHLSVPDWKRAYPAAKLYAAPLLSDKRKDIAFDAELGDGPDAAWAGEVDQVVMFGNVITTEVVFFHVKSGTVLFTDLIQHFPVGWFSGWRALVAKLDLMSAPEPAVPRKFRLAFTNRRAARISLTKILNWSAKSVLMAHGAPVTKDAQAFLKRAWKWLER
ncbi:MAG: DUF4336 domain-containing protein [Parvibaculum sp.]|nr:DUF4336 domain-containing protein [Parvibaculum sp.]